MRRHLKAHRGNRTDELLVRDDLAGSAGTDEQKATPMTTSACQATSTRPPRGHMPCNAPRAGLAVVILMAVAFTVGHLTASSPQGSISGPAQVQAHAGVVVTPGRTARPFGDRAEELGLAQRSPS